MHLRTSSGAPSFWLQTHPAQSVALPAIGEQIDARAVVNYTPDLEIDGGDLLGFVAVDPTRDTIAELQAWWDRVKDDADLWPDE